MTKGECIKKYRLQKGLTQRALGQMCGLADSAVRRYELGKANPKLETIRKIAKALDVSPACLDESLLQDVSGAQFAYNENGELALVREGATYNVAAEEGGEDPSPAARILSALNKLNDQGLEEAAERIEEMTMLKKFQKD